MNILLTGGTGLIGRALCSAMIANGHSLTVYSRQPENVEKRCGNGIKAIASLEEWQPRDHYDAVINLAGEPIVGKRWSDRRKQVLWDSRVTLTQKLIDQIAQAETKPEVLISGSAIGFYGNCGNREVDEESMTGSDFGARMCAAWEEAALKAEDYGVRTCLVRSGLVLSRDGGMLQQMLLPFKLGLGSRIGNGEQWMSWVHIDDEVGVIEKLLSDTKCRGPYNVCAPHPVPNGEFTRSLGKALHRPTFLITPAFLMRLLLGEASELLLTGQRVNPSRIQAAGYTFRHKALDTSLAELIA